MNMHRLHDGLQMAKTLIYDALAYKINKLEREEEGTEYGAYIFKLDNKRIKFRVAKITPKKVGQFVTLWKRLGENPIQPYDIEDPIDLFVICVRNNDRFGQFIFPKALLIEYGIISYQIKIKWEN